VWVGFGSVEAAVQDEKDHEEKKDDSNYRGNERGLLVQIEDGSCD
jgi:hypothetical protein